MNVSNGQYHHYHNDHYHHYYQPHHHHHEKGIAGGRANIQEKVRGGQKMAEMKLEENICFVCLPQLQM